MANNFATLKDNQASNKINLVRINPARFLNDDLASAGGGLYTITLSGFVISSVEENGSALTLVTGTPSSGQYAFNESTGVLTVYPASAPSSTNAIVCFYYLFYTSSKFRVVTEDPENASTTERDWLPRITAPPRIDYDLTDITEGILSVSSSQINLINDQNEFENYLTVNDSFYKKEIKIWLALDDTENIQKIFEGSILDVGIKKDIVSIRIDDPLGQVLQPALCGDTAAECYVTKGDYSNADPSYEGALVPIHFGIVSRYQTLIESVGGLTTAQKLDPNSLYTAASISYSTNLGPSTNRTYLACRVNDDTLDFGFTPSNVDNTGGAFTRLDGTAAQVDKFHVGDTFVAAQGGTDYYLRVYYVDRTNNYIYTTKEAGISTGVVIEGNDMPSVVVTNETDETYYLLYERDYTIINSATSGGNRELRISLASNFESNHPGLSTWDPTVYKVKYRVKPDPTNQKHGDIISYLLGKAGITVDSTSISNANTAFSKEVNFSIPYFDQEDYSNYIDYIQLILRSTFGYLTLGNDFEIEYKLFDTPSSTTVINDIDIIKDSFSVQVLYRDIVSKIIAYNPHYASAEATEDSNDSPSVTLSSNKAVHLHGIDNTTRFRHVLSSINDRLTLINNFRSERKANYVFDTKVANIDSIIGDEFELEKGEVLGTGTTQDIVILGLTKSTDKTKVSATDLYNA